MANPSIHSGWAIPAELAAQAPPDFEERRAQLGVDYELRFVPEWIPELKEKYGLKMLGE